MLHQSLAFHAELWYETLGWVLDRSQPLNATTHVVQQKAKQVMATETVVNIMISKRE